MSRYANNTSVAPEKSRAEIERTLARYGATDFAYMSNVGGAKIAFAVPGPTTRVYKIRFDIELPRKDEREFTHTESRSKPRSPEAAYIAWEQACKQRWRALALVVKAKLEAVECGITTFEQEFMAHMILPGGRTVFDEVMPRIEQSYDSGNNVPLLEMT